MSRTRRPPPSPHLTPSSPSRVLVRLRQAGIGNVRTLRAEELAGDVEGLAADHNDLLAVEELLGDDAGKATEEVALAVNDDLASSMLATRVCVSQFVVPPGPIPSPMFARASSRLLLCVGGRRQILAIVAAAGCIGITRSGITRTTCSKVDIFPVVF